MQSCMYNSPPIPFSFFLGDMQVEEVHTKDYKNRILNILKDEASKIPCTFSSSGALKIETLPEIEVHGMSDLLAFPFAISQASALKEVS